MPTISELSALAALSKLDKFEVERAADNTSYSVTAQDIATFVKNISNGGFKGTTDKSLDSFTIADIGMWWWNSESIDQNIELNAGVVEIISYYSPDDEHSGGDTFIQRITYMDRIYQRQKLSGTWRAWTALSNRNGCEIHYGIGKSSSISFPRRFNAPPAVIVSPYVSDDQFVYVVKVKTSDNTGFTVTMMKSDTIAVIENTQTTESESGGTTTKTTTTTITQGAWEEVTPSDSEPFFWIALSDYGG